MRILKSGVKIFLGARRMCWDRVQLSVGTVTAPPTVRGLAYEEGARIPIEEWRAPTSYERSILVAKTLPQDLGTTVGIIKMPPHLLRSFKKLENAAITFSERMRILPFVNDASCVAGIEGIKRFLQGYFQTPSGHEGSETEGGIVVKAPALTTVTRDPRSGKLVGLHLDDWYRFPLDRRHESPNRICINIGSQDRFLLFLNLPIGKIRKEVLGEPAGSGHETLGGTAVGRLFMTRFPRYPVIRIRIKPGDAYIAPTENIIHDGSSIESLSFDVSLSLRGTFNLSTALTFRGI